MSGDDPQLSALIGRIYDAALDETLWAGLASEIAAAMASSSTVIATVRPGGLGTQFLSKTENYAARAMADWASYYHQHDVWAARGAELGMGDVWASKDLIADAEFERTEFCQDWCRTLDIFYVVGSVMPVAADQIAIIGIHRGRGGGTYEESDKRRVAQIVPHLRRALQLRDRLVEVPLVRHAGCEAFERTGFASLVVDSNGRLLYANAAATTVLRQGDGLHTSGERVRTREATSGERLAMLIRTAAAAAAGKGSSAGGALAIPRGDRLPLTALVAPFRPAREGLGAPLPAAIVFLRDPEEVTPSSLLLRDLFGLTPTEASLAAALAEGKALEAIATAHRISLYTARTHLKSIFAKTGTRRQAELVARLLGSVATLAPP